MKRPTAIHVTMKDHSVWAVPAEVIAKNRAQHYKHEFHGNLQRSLNEDTWPLFEEDAFEILDWATNNMNWDEVAAFATKVSGPPVLTADDFQEGWTEGKKVVK